MESRTPENGLALVTFSTVCCLVPAEYFSKRRGIIMVLTGCYL